MAGRFTCDTPVRAGVRPSGPVAENGAMETTGLADTAEPPAASRIPEPRDVVILGSTGSIGTQALDIIRRNPIRSAPRRLNIGRASISGIAAVLPPQYRP